MPEKLGAFGVGFLFVYFLLIPPCLSLFGLGIWASNRLLFDLNSEMIHALLKGYLVLHLLSENLTFYLLPANLVKNEEIIF